MAKTRGPEFVRFFGPLLDSLRELGGSGRPKEVSEKIADSLKISDDELNRTNKNGYSRFENQVAWARFYLAKAGLIDTSRRGVWTLTEEGRSARMDRDAALRRFHAVHKLFRDDRSDTATALAASDETASPPDSQDTAEDIFSEEMAKMLQSLPPEGFERLCQRILREVGFDEVIVTGRSGDGGIDGFGTLRINRLVSDRVLFQCKRHTKQISPAYIREFRGSMAGRADRGIFLATSSFTAEARREAAREGAAPIEMVDLGSLISLLSDLGLGVTARTVFALDRQFFREYGASEAESGPA